MQYHEVDLPAFAAAHAGGATVIDVREPYEYTAGHVPGARLVPMEQLPRHADECQWQPEPGRGGLPVPPRGTGVLGRRRYRWLAAERPAAGARPARQHRVERRRRVERAVTAGVPPG
jgi:hypothetical protein